MMKLEELTIAQLSQLAADVRGELSARAGEALLVEGRGVDLRPPAGGALLRVDWAVADQSYTQWYPTISAATAALEILAERHGRKAHAGRVDLTEPGCHPSTARVVDRTEAS